MAGMSAAVSPWVRRFHPAPQAPVRLVCFPHAGGSASSFFPYSKEFAPSLDVFAIQYPGRQDRLDDSLVDTVAGLAQHSHAELRPWLDRPVVLFGHSMGAAVAFETARLLESAGTPPLGLIASGCRAPSLPRRDNVHQRDEDGLIAELATLNGTDPTALGDRELLRVVLPALRSDYRAIETYAAGPGATVRAPILVLTGDADERVTLEQARAWSAHTTARATVEVIAGGHFFPATARDRVAELVRGQVAAWAGQA